MKLDGKSLTLDEIEKFLSGKIKIELTVESKRRVKKARAMVDKWVATDEVVYGITTGFGEFANVKISQENLEQLQENLIIKVLVIIIMILVVMVELLLLQVMVMVIQHIFIIILLQQ